MNATVLDHVPTVMRPLADFDYKGFLVSYSIQGTGIRVQRDVLQQRLDAVQLGDLMPPDISQRVAMTRALTAFAKARAAQGGTRIGRPGYANQNEDDDGDDESDSQMVQCVEPKKGQDYFVFYLINRKVDWAQLGLSFLTTLRIKLYKSGTIVVTTTETGDIDGTAIHAVERELQPFWDEHRHLYLGVDVSPIIKAELSRQWGVLTRSEGGLYFVPAEAEDSLDRLHTFIGSLPNYGYSAPSFVAIPVLDLPKVTTALANSVHRGVMSEINQLRADLGKLQASKPGTVEAKTVRDRHSQYRMLMARAETYGNLLGMRQDIIKGEIDALRAAARALIVVQTAEDVAKEQASATVANQPVSE